MNAVEKCTRHLQEQAKRLFQYTEKQTLRFGGKCDHYIDNASSLENLVCYVLLRIPLFFIIHQWLLLSPYSNCWNIEIFLFIFRYGVALLFVGTYELNSGVLLQFYTILTFDMAVMWLRRTDYWTHKDVAYGISHGKNILVWSNITEYWRVPAIFSILLQAAHICYRPGAYIPSGKERVTKWIYIVLLTTLVPNILSFLSIFPSFMSGLSYWIDSALFVLVCLSEIVSSKNLDLSVDKKILHFLTVDQTKRRKYRTRIKKLQRRIDIRSKGGKNVGISNMLNLIVVFGYFCLSFFRRQLTSNMILNTFLDVFTILCTRVIRAIWSLLPRYTERFF